MKILLFGLAVWLGAASHAVAAVLSPVGVWRTFDDDGRETGRVQIWEQDKTIYARIVAIADPAKAKAICRDCTDDRRNQPVMGMQIMRGLHADGDRWAGGEVLDPQNGSVYGCSLRLADGGRKLVVRGYLGISLFGRTQTWTRAE